MVWCAHCKRDRTVLRDEDGRVSCDGCGRVIYDDQFTDEPTFVKGPGGESRMAGSFVRSIASGYSDSFRRTLDKGEDEIRHIALVLTTGESVINPATSFYRMALERNFTRGRRTRQVAAACLYIACRTTKPPKPFLLIDFSETLKINVYVLGSVFLQLCQVLNLWEHDIIKSPVDPTLFIPRFTEKLLDGRNVEVSRTAMHIIASMKRDWMQTGRKPSGLCGAALYISALSHGFKFSKSDIVKIVHICEVTLTKRLIEFENTESGSLTIEELDNSAKELKKCKFSSFGSQKSGERLCKHKGGEQPPHFAHGLCKSCFEDFIELSGGLEGGSDPPAFQQAEKMREANASVKKTDEFDVNFLSQHKEKSTELENETDENIESFTEASQNVSKNERLNSTGSEFLDGTATDGTSDTNKFKDTSSITSDESDGLSDIDDIEVSGYLNNEEEMRLKKIVWEEMNREYLEEQAAKRDAEGNSLSTSKPKKERRHKRDQTAIPAQTPAEAARQMLSKKSFSSKINYAALEKCFSADGTPQPNKKPKVSSSHDDGGGGGGANGQSPGDKVPKSAMVDNKDNEFGEEYEYMEGKEEEHEGEGYDEGTATGHDMHFEDDVYGYDYGYDDDNEY